MASKIRNKPVTIGFLLITALFIYVSLFFILKEPASPYFLAPFFVIHNHDVNSHEVTVEVLDQHNESIINETYSLEPGSDVSRSRPLSLWLQQEKREYTFKVTMDAQITNKANLEILDSHTSASIRLYTVVGETIPYDRLREPIPILIEAVEY